MTGERPVRRCSSPAGRAGSGAAVVAALAAGRRPAVSSWTGAPRAGSAVGGVRPGADPGSRGGDPAPRGQAGGLHGVVTAAGVDVLGRLADVPARCGNGWWR